MSVITFPSVAMPAEFSLTLFNQQYASGSGETLAGQIIETLGVPFIWSGTWSHVLPEDADAFQAFDDQMQGYKNMVLLGNILRQSPKGTASGAPLVNGASQTGTVLNIDGMTVGQTFVAGDMIGVANLLYRVVAAATVNGSGQAALTIRPPIVVAPPDNALVTLSYPKTYFRKRVAYTPFTRAVGEVVGGYKSFTYEFIQVLP